MPEMHVILCTTTCRANNQGYQQCVININGPLAVIYVRMHMVSRSPTKIPPLQISSGVPVLCALVLAHGAVVNLMYVFRNLLAGANAGACALELFLVRLPGNAAGCCCRGVARTLELACWCRCEVRPQCAYRVLLRSCMIWSKNYEIEVYPMFLRVVQADRHLII